MHCPPCFSTFSYIFPVECLSNAWLNGWLNFWGKRTTRRSHILKNYFLFIVIHKILRYNSIVEKKREREKENNILISPLSRIIKFHKNISYKNCAILRHDRENRIYPSSLRLMRYEGQLLFLLSSDPIFSLSISDNHFKNEINDPLKISLSNGVVNNT